MPNYTKDRSKYKYSENDKAKVIAAAISMGYPSRKGSRRYAREALQHDHRTLTSWYKKVDVGLIEKQIMELKDLIDKELTFIFEAMEFKRDTASYKELATSAGILMDKAILLQGGATSRTENISTSWKDLIESARQDENKPQEFK